MRKFSKSERLNLIKAGAMSYTVASTIAYLKHSGIEFINQSGTWVLKVHKTMGVIDVFRLDGHLKNMDVFGSDWLFFTVGMFAAVLAALVMKVYDWAQTESKPQTEKTAKGFKVKLNHNIEQ